MSDFSEKLESALKANAELLKGAHKIVAEHSVNLDKVSPEIRAKFKEAEREVKEKEKELESLKNNL